jgi:hypothetical protein
MADFLRVNYIDQRPTVLHCPECDRTWAWGTPQQVLNIHVCYFHPLTWDDFLAYRRDVRELWKIWSQ